MLKQQSSKKNPATSEPYPKKNTEKQPLPVQEDENVVHTNDDDQNQLEPEIGSDEDSLVYDVCTDTNLSCVIGVRYGT